MLLTSKGIGGGGGGGGREQGRMQSYQKGRELCVKRMHKTYTMAISRVFNDYNMSLLDV